MAHEIGHLAQGVDYTGETNLYTDQIINLYQESTGTTNAEVEDGIRRIMERYLAEAERSGSSLNINRSDVTMDYARGEYAADRLAEMLGQYNTLRKIAKKQNRNIIQKALSLVGKFQGSLASKLRSHANKNEITWVDIAEIYDEAASNLEKILRESMENARKTKIPSEDSSLRASSTASLLDAGSSTIRDKTQAEITKEYGKNVDAILSGEYNSQDNVLMGYTPNLLKELGVPNLPVVIGPGHVYSIAKTAEEAQADGRFHKGTNYHGMGESTVKTLYEKFASPIAVIASKDIDTKRFPVRSQRSVVEIIDIGSENKSLLAAVEITVDRRVQGTTMDVNVLSSAYERNVAGLLQEAIAQENSGGIGVFYIKNKTVDMVAGRGTIPTGAYHAAVSGTILHQIPEKINLRIQNQTQTSQFTDWFGDWQNHPTNASKVVNEDGTPKVMYHGTSNGGFNVFDPYSSNFGLFGTGSYFTDNQDVAKSYTQKGKGENPQVYAAYLNIRNPLDMDANASITKS